MLTHTLGCYQSCKTGSDVIDPAASLFCAGLSSLEDARRVIAPGLSLNVIHERVRTGGILFHEGIEGSAFPVGSDSSSSFKKFIKNDVTQRGRTARREFYLHVTGLTGTVRRLHPDILKKRDVTVNG